MLELKKVVTTKTTVNDCIIEKSCLQSVKVKTKRQERTFKKHLLKSIYHIDSFYINVVHYNGRNKRLDICMTAYYCVFKSLRRATTKRAIELFEGRNYYTVDDWQDLILTATAYALYGYVDGNNNYHKGYYTDRIADIKELTATIYSAVNAVLYKKGAIGKWTGKEVLTEDYSEVKTVVNIFNYVKTNYSKINSEKWNSFLTDVKNALTNKQLEVFNCILDNEYINTKDFSTDLIAITLNKSKQAVCNITKRIKEKCEDIVTSKYNMTKTEFINYVSA